jgi:Spy/CpxP family protein refolding chaperone
MRRLLWIALLMFPLAAQPPRGMMNWWDSPLARDLNLTEDQTRQIRSIVREQRSRLMDQRRALERAETGLEEAFNDEVFDQKRANEALERVVAARGELTRSFTQMNFRMRALLTHDQFRELQRRRPRMFGPQGQGPGNGGGQRGPGNRQHQQAPPPPPPPPQQ